MEETKDLKEEETTAAEEVKPDAASAPTEENKAEEKPAETKEKTAETAEKPLEAEEKAPEEEKKADDISGDYNGHQETLNTSYFNPIHYTNDGTISIDDDINRIREKFNSKLSKSRVIDIVSIVLMVLAFVAVLVVTFALKGKENLAWVTYLVLGISLAVIILSFILTAVFNKKNAKITKDYLNEYEDMLNGYVISDLKVKNPTLCVEAKVDDQEIIQAHYFRTINKIESRAVVEGTRNDYHFSLAEVAVVIPPVSFLQANKKPEDLLNLDGSKYIPDPVGETMTGTQELASKDMTMLDLDLSKEVLDPKQAKKRERDQKRAAANKQTETATGLFGKIYSYGAYVDSEEAIIITFMGDKENTVLPDYLTGFKALKVPGLRNNIVVYAVNPLKSSKFFDEVGVKLLNDITTNPFVQSCFISINSYGSKIGMNLSDDIMQLPIKPLSHTGAFETYKNATDKAFAFVDYVTSKTGI